jgi:biotin transporter BioY
MVQDYAASITASVSKKCRGFYARFKYPITILFRKPIFRGSGNIAKFVGPTQFSTRFSLQSLGKRMQFGG